MKTKLLPSLLILALCAAFGCSPKYGCPASGGNIGAEKAMDQKKTPKYSRKLQKF